MSFQEWRSINRGKFAATLFHRCTKTCKLVQLMIYSCPIKGECIGGGVYPIVVIDEDGKRQCRYVQNQCHQKHHVLMHDIKLWGCIISGNAHYCGVKCNQVIETTEGYTVCDLTGHILSEHVVERKAPLPAGVVFQKTSDFKSEYIRHAPLQVSMADLHRHVAHGITKKSGHVIRSELFSACLVFVTQYLTKRISETNIQRPKERDDEVHRMVDALANARRRTPKIKTLELVHYVAVLRSKQPYDIIINIPPDDIRKHSSSLSTRIVALMGTLRSKIPEGRRFVDSMSLKDFFLVGLDMCRQGLFIEKMNLLSVDPILILVADGPDDISQFWKESVDRKRIRKSILKAPLTVKTLFSDAVTRHRVNPENLRIDELATSIQNIPSDFFEGYRHGP